MSKYAYQARNRSGELFSGKVEAVSRGEAARLVRQKGLWVTSLTECDGAAVAEARVATQKKQSSQKNSAYIWRKITASRPHPDELVMLFRELSVLLGAGLPIHQALKMLADGADGAYGELLTNLHAAVLQGKSFSAALEKTDLFPASIVSLVRAGEAGGTLDALLTTIADFEERRFAAREKLKSALLYPVLLLLATVLSFVVLVVFILPTFATMLRNLDAELPLITRMLLWSTDVLRDYPLPLLAAIVLVGYMVFFTWQIPAIRYGIERAKLYIPLYGELVNCSAWSAVCGTVAVLLANGITLHEGLELARDSVANTYLASRIAAIKKSVEGGKTLHQSLALCPEFPEALGELVLAGEESGMLDAMLERAAYFANLRAENAAARLEALAQPLAIFLVGGLVLLFVLAVLMPILSLVDVLA